MTPERLPQSPSPERENETSKTIIESLVSHGTVENEGANGIIFSIPSADIAPIAQDLWNPEVALPHSTALKIVKFNRNPEQARREAHTQQRVFEILNTARRQGHDVALTPPPRYFFVGSVTEEEEQGLSRHEHDPHRTTSDKIPFSQGGIFVMDFISGAKDIAHIYYQEALLHLFRAGNEKVLAHWHSEHDIETAPFPALHQSIGMILGFSRPQNPLDRIAQAANNRDNAKKLFAVISRFQDKAKAPIIDPAIVKTMDNTINLLREHGFHWNDGHERNWLIQGNYSYRNAQDCSVYILDFGTSYFNDELSSSAAHGETIPDNSVPLHLKSLIAEKRSNGSMLLEKIESIKNVPPAPYLRKELSEIIGSIDEKKLLVALRLRYEHFIADPESLPSIQEEMLQVINKMDVLPSRANVCRAFLELLAEESAMFRDEAI